MYIWGQILLVTLALAGCASSVSPAKKKSSSGGESETTFQVVSIEPTGGIVSAVPSTITVIFTNSPRRDMLAAQTHYSLNCTGETIHASAVNAVSGYASVTVSFDSIVPPSGSKCVFTVASNTLDEANQRLGGERTATYSISY